MSVECDHRLQPALLRTLVTQGVWAADYKCCCVDSPPSLRLRGSSTSSIDFDLHIGQGFKAGVPTNWQVFSHWAANLAPSLFSTLRQGSWVPTSYLGLWACTTRHGPQCLIIVWTPIDFCRDEISLMKLRCTCCFPFVGFTKNLGNFYALEPYHIDCWGSEFEPATRHTLESRVGKIWLRGGLNKVDPSVGK